MTSEQLISELDDFLKKEDRYTFLKYINENKSLFISAISIISAIVFFVARMISFLVVHEKYLFWNLDEGFLVEDNRALLKVGEFILFFLLQMLITSFTSRYAYRYELYNCELYLYDRIIAYQIKEFKKCKKDISKLNKSAVSKGNTNSSKREDILRKLSQLEKDDKDMRKNCKEAKKQILKERLILIVKFLFAMAIVFGATLLLQLFPDSEIGGNRTISLFISTTFITLAIMFSSFVCSFLEIRITISFILKRSFEDKKIDWGSDLIKIVIDWLKSKISEKKKQSAKVFLSDRSLKMLLMNFIITTILLTICLPLYVKNSLKRMESFYVFREAQQEYVMLINDGTKYIFAGCDIDDNKIIIDTNKIIVRKDPVSLEKKQFESVEKKQ